MPVPCLVVLVGASGAGKSSFARRHFGVTEVVSSDACRAMLVDDPGDQSATAAAFGLLRYIVRRRLARGRLTVVDATNVQARSRRPYLALAERYGVAAVAVVLDVPEAVCVARAGARDGRAVAAGVVAEQCAELRGGLDSLYREGFRVIHHLGQSDVDGGVVIRRLVGAGTP